MYKRPSVINCLGLQKIGGTAENMTKSNDCQYSYVF